MALSSFRINQTSTGTYDVSRRDVLPTSIAGTPVEFEAQNVAVTYKWEVTQTPGSAVPLVGSTLATCTLSAELEGGYLVRLTADEGLSTESITELYFGIGVEVAGVRYALPALTETVQDNSIGHPEYGWLEKELNLFKALAAASADRVTWVGTTADATLTEIYVGGVPGARQVVPASAVTAYVLNITAYASATTKGKTWRVNCGIIRDGANNTALLDVPVVTVLAQSDLSGGGAGTDLWDITITADDTDETLVIEVEGEAATPIAWQAHS